MSIIDKTYFIREINLPVSVDVSANLNSFIAIYEAEYLQYALGYSLMKAFVDGLTADEPEQRWIDLRDGAEFTDCKGFTDKWTGFKNDDKQSPIANYTYFFYSRKHPVYIYNGGDKGQNSKATVKNQFWELKRAFDTMVEQTMLLHEFLKANADVYPEFNIKQVSCKVLEKIPGI